MTGWGTSVLCPTGDHGSFTHRSSQELFLLWTPPPQRGRCCCGTPRRNRYSTPGMASTLRCPLHTPDPRVPATPHMSAPQVLAPQPPRQGPRRTHISGLQGRGPAPGTLEPKVPLRPRVRPQLQGHSTVPHTETRRSMKGSLLGHGFPCGVRRRGGLSSPCHRRPQEPPQMPGPRVSLGSLHQ